MGNTTLNEITSKIISVIQDAVDKTGNWPGLRVLPELIKNKNQGIGFYLFHVQQNPIFYNLPRSKNDIIQPIETLPLNLYYHLSANSINSSNEEDALEEQRLMTVAMKALHNSPIIYSVSEEQIILKINNTNMSLSESIDYWAANKSPMRLCAYYQVSGVLL